ncbi:MAG: hypothetical protein EVG15_06210 [Candidatus Acididesulfobacter diazotrophicus]|uniref:Uncharacterized protein n=1 Tax=Candidatus Acididesulfobacter diazotrophicus TaxID=2597226 RepID=A0A519BM49_9DELT|nr:MAG: hypothetical protein EVG15_06210 [Candidatus Acididesulfobacter diazotrophicus]
MGYALPEIKKKGWTALVKELGYAGATKFILIYEAGDGNYTRERKELFKNEKIDAIYKEIKK